MACNRDKTLVYQTDEVVLKWHKSYPTDSFDKSITGLNWALSMIGASKRISNNSISYGNNTITLDPNELSLSIHTQEVLKKLHRSMRESVAYDSQGHMDIGHYISLLIGASEHYYALVDLPDQLLQLQNQYTLQSAVGFVSDSEISDEHREIRFSNQDQLKQLFVSEEIDSISGETLEFETLDLLPNGQPRYGIYDPLGNRIIGAYPGVSSAGKPGKCMWCHESSIQPLFSVQDMEAGYLTPTELADTLIHFRNEHKTKQDFITDGVDFQNIQGHVFMELLYISYMEPSAARLALEWEIPEVEVLNLLTGLSTHEHEEFTFLGLLYDRKDVEPLSPLTPLGVSSSVRERLGTEVNYVN